MKFNIDYKNVSKYPIKDLTESFNKAHTLYCSKHFEEAYSIIISISEYFDLFAEIGLREKS